MRGQVERLDKRKERHQRQRQRMYQRMLGGRGGGGGGGGKAEPREEGTPSSALRLALMGLFAAPILALVARKLVESW